MRSNLTATFYVDASTVDVQPVHTKSDDGRPFIFVALDDGELSIWGHDAAAFRRLAAALIEAADTLDKTAEQLRAAEPATVQP